MGRPAKGLSTKKKPVGRQAGDTAAKRPVGRPPAAGGTKDADKTAATAKRRRETKDADAPAKRPRGRPPKAKEDVKRTRAGTDASPSGDGDDDGDVSEKENESDEEDEAVSDDVRTPSARGLEEPVRSANVTAASAKPPLPPVFIVRGQYRTADEVTKDAAKAVREAEAAAAAAERAAETAERREREAWEAERLASRLLEEAERQRREADEAEEDAAGGGVDGAPATRAMWAA